MPQQIIISEQLRIAALLTDERIDELIVAKGHHQIGDVYVGTVENVLPGIDAAFVNIGENEKNGFIHVNDLGPLRLKKANAGITELLEPKQKVLVQVIKEPTGNKGPRLTGNLALPGRYLVLQPHGQGVNISRKINSETERNRLRALGVLIKPPGTGLLVRTEANTIKEELLIDDLENLLKQWESIQQAAEANSPPCLLNRDEDFIHRILRDHITPQLTRVVVEDSAGIERVQAFLNQNTANIVVEAHDQGKDLLDHYKINLAIHNALQPRVELPSGGYIIIEPTEALTVIDVNSGSFTRSANARETVLWTNCEAAKEIARQLKLRNIGGVIIIDFIDMDSRKDQLQLLEHFSSAIQDDSARPQIAQLTELGLVELTRKRQGQNIYELFGKPCPHCYGQGHITVLPKKDDSPMSMENANSSPQELSLSNIESRHVNEPNSKSASQLNHSSEITNDCVNEQSVSNPTENNTSEVSNRKEKTELIAVQMNSDEEYIYSLLGLNPALLLEENPVNDNFMVHIVRPGEKVDEVLHEARQQLLSNSHKRRKKARPSLRTLQKAITDNHSSSTTEEPITQSDIHPEEENLLPEIAPIEEASLSMETTTSETEVLSSEESLEDPRRRRRRSSATN